MDQWSFTAPHEGIVPHLYLDTRGNPTCGVGFLVPDEKALVKLPWQPNVQAALADYWAVKRAQPGRVASAYRPLCKARLTEADMRALFDEHVRSFRKQMDPTWKLALHPEPVQIALTDMAFNLGVGGLNKYRKLHTAVFAQQWRVAAAECSRRGIGQARNDATRALFLSAEATV